MNELISAVRNGELERVQELISATDLTPLSSQSKYILLCGAIRDGHVQIVKQLLQNGFPVNTPASPTIGEDHKQDSPLSIAIGTCNLELVQVLLDAGACVNQRNQSNNTPLYEAVALNSTEIVKLPLDNNADENHQTLPANKLVKLLIQHGALNALNFENDGDRRLLCKAAEKGYRQIFEISLKLGADINPIDSNGLSTLEFACEKSPKLVEYLLEYGCEVDVEKYSSNNSLDILRNHTLKLNVAEFNKYYMMRSEYSEGIEELADQCLNEMEIIEDDETIADSNILFYDLFTKDTFLLASFAKNKSVVEYILSQECEQFFPAYANVLRGIIWRGIIRKSLQEHGLKIFRYYCKDLPCLPDHCVENIFRFMNDNELRSLVRGHLEMFSFAQEVIEENVKGWISEDKEGSSEDVEMSTDLN